MPPQPMPRGATPPGGIGPPRSPPARVRSFAPVTDPRTRILILGSMPGIASLHARQYYAHPRNHFWRLLADIGVAAPGLPYHQRLQSLLAHGLGLWDVLHSCVRTGSLDAAIDARSALPNDLLPLLRASPVTRVCCNGGTAYASLRRHFGRSLANDFPHIEIHRLPSTSPANAGCSYQRKLAAWREVLS